MLKSIIDIGKLIFRRKRPEVIFYYPRHFNRGKNDTNPFFAPLIKACANNGINYAIIEEPDGRKEYRHNQDAYRGDTLLWLVIIIRKLLRICKIGKGDNHRERICGKVINVLTFGRLRTERYITISNSFTNVLEGINPKAKVYDMQHGIIYSTHGGYFMRNGRIASRLLRENQCVMLWGPIFANAFMQNPLNAEKCDLNNKIAIVGYPCATATGFISNNVANGRNLIVFSLQITEDLSAADANRHVEMLRDALESANVYGLRIVLKHHPRFNGEADLSDILLKYPNVEVSNRPHAELMPEALLHITWNSTTAFEYAEAGVPTFFLYDNEGSMYLTGGHDIFYKEYHYPLYDGMSLGAVIERLKDSDSFKEDSDAVKKWYRSAYAPFDAQAFLNLIRPQS